MISRYSAFCIKDIDYLISTRHRSKRGLNEREMLAQTIYETQWLGLKILKTDKSQIMITAKNMMVPAFFKNCQLFLNACPKVSLALGQRYGGNSMIKSVSSFLKNVLLKIRAIIMAKTIPII